ncbi:MAG: hypothetical protein ABID61_04090 [Candidatus Micrarchaeota archaeon]
MTIANQSRAFITIDGMVSLLPILLILFLLAESISFLSNSNAKTSHNQIFFNKLVSIADYTVKSGAAIHQDNIRYSNWIDEQKLNAQFVEDLRQKTDLNNLYISTTSQQNYSVCIYRLVVVGSNKDIKKLFVCGGFCLLNSLRSQGVRSVFPKKGR